VIGLRLVLAALRDDTDAVNTISREASGCAGCWQQSARHQQPMTGRMAVGWVFLPPPRHRSRSTTKG
jgi:hypothetical protein